jgi:carotenoid cleavage dioxygenase
MAGAMRGEPVRSDINARSSLFSLDLVSGRSRVETLMDKAEFPRVASVDVGRRHRQIYMLADHDGDTLGLSSVARFDLDRGKVDSYNFGADSIVEEHIPVAKANGHGMWLIGPSYDVRQHTTVLNVFDGDHIAHGPVARARLPYATPLCFHGNFLAA